MKRMGGGRESPVPEVGPRQGLGAHEEFSLGCVKSEMPIRHQLKRVGGWTRESGTQGEGLDWGNKSGNRHLGDCPSSKEVTSRCGQREKSSPRASWGRVGKK